MNKITTIDSFNIDNNLSDEEFLGYLYREILGRDPDESGFRDNYEFLQKGGSRATLTNIFFDSAEYSNRVYLGGRDPLLALHKSRIQAVLHLPKAEIIVDLGGGSIGDKRGALVAMGYPYSFTSLYIVEPGPSDRHEIYKKIPDIEEVIETASGAVKYLYGSMSDLSFFKNESVDLVFSGETIEHVSIEDCKKTLKEVRRILKKDGFFCFDTPNRAITKIQLPNSYINPDHKIEYHHDEMMELLREARLKPVEILGITHMPKTSSTQIFDLREMVENTGLNFDFLNSYLIYYKCIPI